MRGVRIGLLALLVAGCGQPAVEAPAPPAQYQVSAPSEAAAPEAVPTAPEKRGYWAPISTVGEAVSSSGRAVAAADGELETEWNPKAKVTAETPQWLAVPLARPAHGRLAVVWHSHGRDYQKFAFAKPRTYDLEVSADSTDGEDGTWRVVETVVDNPVRSRVSIVEAPGARWVRMKFKLPWSTVEAEPFMREVSVLEEQEPGRLETWLIMGDSVMAVAFNPVEDDTFTPRIAEKHGGAQVVLVPGATGGDRSLDLVERLEELLPTLPPGTVIGMSYGANDAKQSVPLETYRASLQAGIDLIKARGHVPVLAVVPWNLNGAIGEYAEVCRELQEANGLAPGPDFFTYFKAHPEELRTDKVHPTPQGIAAIHRLWAEAAAFRF
ncbi:MAG: SGNH/GDSL hydrolase family protein [Candidatus Sericytochromatia bacterium]